MRTLNHCLKGAPTLLNLMSQVDAQQRLMQQVEAMLPAGWRGHLCGIAPAEGGWTLLVDASVWASRLRMYLPQLSEKTQTLWRVRVIAPTAPIKTFEAPVRLNRPPPPHSQSLEKLAEDETEPRLRLALLRLAGRS